MRTMVRHLASEYGVTMFISSHLLSEVEQMAGQVGIIQAGRLVFQGTPEGLRAQYQDHVALGVDQPGLAARAVLARNGWQVSRQRRHRRDLRQRLSAWWRPNGQADAGLLATQLVQAGLRVHQRKPGTTLAGRCLPAVDPNRTTRAGITGTRRSARMISLSRALVAETMKTKRTLALAMTVLAPLIIAVLQVAVPAAASRVSAVDRRPEKAWLSFSKSTLVYWSLLMLPLYITLETTLLSGLDHNQNHWTRVVHHAGARRWAFYAAKVLVAMALIALSNVVMLGWMLLDGAVLQAGQSRVRARPAGAVASCTEPDGTGLCDRVVDHLAASVDRHALQGPGCATRNRHRGHRCRHLRAGQRLRFVLSVDDDGHHRGRNQPKVPGRGGVTAMGAAGGVLLALLGAGGMSAGGMYCRGVDLPYAIPESRQYWSCDNVAIGPDPPSEMTNIPSRQ